MLCGSNKLEMRSWGERRKPQACTLQIVIVVILQTYWSTSDPDTTLKKKKIRNAYFIASNPLKAIRLLNGHH